MANVQGRMEIAPGADLTADPDTYPWQDVTTDLRGSIVREVGAQDEAALTQSGMGFVLNDRLHRYTVDNPMSDLWGEWDLGTPCRWSVNLGDAAGWTIKQVAYVAELTDLIADARSKWLDRVLVVAAGLKRRLGQGKALKSPMRRAPLAESTLVEFWPLEDGVDATSGGSALDGGYPVVVNRGDTNPSAGGTVAWGADAFAGSSASVDIGGLGTLAAPCRQRTLTEWRFEWAFNLGTDHFKTAADIDIWCAFIDGRRLIWSVGHNNAGDATMTLKTQIGNADVVTQLALNWNSGPTWLNGLFDGKDHIGALEIKGTAIIGADYKYYIDDDLVSSGTFGLTWANPVTAPTLITAGAGGAFTNAPTNAATYRLGMWALYSTSTTPATPRYEPSLGWTGELAGDRIIRLCNEEKIPVDTSCAGLGAALGRQRPDATVLDLLEQSAAADFGPLDDSLGRIAFRPLSTMYNQTPSLVINAANRELFSPISPVRDDQRYRNSVKASRPDGGEATASDDAEITRVGLYDADIQPNLATEAQLPMAAAWRIGVGKGSRWPAMKIKPMVAVQYRRAWLDTTFGDVLRVSNYQPERYPDPDRDLMLLGYIETIQPPYRTWEAQLNTCDAQPWAIGKLDQSRLQADSSTLAGSGWDGVSSSFTVATAAGPLWSTAGADYPSDVMIAGQRVTISAVSGASSPQTFTVSVPSVNRVRKTHPAGTKITVYRPIRLGL